MARTKRESTEALAQAKVDAPASGGFRYRKEDRRALLDAFFRERPTVNHHLASYNAFLPTHDNPNSNMQKVVNAIHIGDEAKKGEIVLDLESLGGENIIIKLGKIRVDTPKVREANGSTHDLTPMEAHLRNLTYQAPCFLEFTIVIDGIEQEPEEVRIGNLPIMCKSKLCNLYHTNVGSLKLHGFPERRGEMSEDEYKERLIRLQEDPLDPGGFFVINGSERVLITLEDLAPNRVMVEFSDRYGRKTEVAKVFSEFEGYRALTLIEKKRDGQLVVSVPAAAGVIPLVILMKALGLEDDEDIRDTIVSEDEMEPIVLANIEDAIEEHTVSNTTDALDYLERKFASGQAKEYREKKVQSIIDRSLLPHLGDGEKDRLKKAIFLGRVARNVLELHLGKRPPDDKDHYMNKRLKLSGDLVEDLFRVSFQNLLKDLKYQLERGYVRKKQLKISSAIRPDLLTTKILHALATGNWVGGRTGVSQLVDRTSHMSSVGHMRRVTSPLARTQPHFEARDLHSTQWGRLCPCETPEGQNCGLVKNLALMVDISEGTSVDQLRIQLADLGVRKESVGQAYNEARVFINGNLIGFTDEPELLTKSIRERRRRGHISHEVNVRFDDQMHDVILNSDSGRIRRLLVVVENGQPRYRPEYTDKLKRREIDLNDLVMNGIVEWIDAEEEENALIGVYEKDLNMARTHLEVDPVAILGLNSSLIPYPEHNSSPRVTMGAAMAKQSLGLPASNYRVRPDTRGHLLHYPQKPISQTKTMDYIGLNRRPQGQNFCVAVMSLQGYNMEDALILNRASIDRGLGRSSFFRTYRAEERRYPGGQEDHFEIPNPEVRGARADLSYTFLEEDGLITPEVHVASGDVLIGKTSPPRFLEEQTDFLAPQKRRETSVTIRHGESGYVDSVLLTESENGSRLVKIKVRNERIPQYGDKFASRHGQKGVVGMLVPPDKVPFTGEGMTPDLMVNPHGIPSRMTIAHVLEMLAGKVGSMEGRTIDGTAFSGEKEQLIREGLMRVGFKHNGRHVFHNPETGERIPAHIFMGVIYYQKLHHMVAGKMHVRSRGPVQILTRQPTEGRARQGGLRFGEMERDTLIAHGASMVIKDRLLDESDGVKEYICDKCGHVAMMNRQGYLRCMKCEDKSEIYPVQTSYAFKLLLDELKSLCVVLRLKLGDLT